MLNIIGKKHIFITLSALLALASLASILFFGLKPGIDFAGGVAWQIKFFGEAPSQERLAVIASEGTVIPQENGVFLIRLKELDEAAKESLLSEFRSVGELEELQFQNIGPVIGNELRRKAIWAFGLVLALISIYVAFAFRKVSKPVSSWKYGIIALVTLFHDAVIPAGLFALLGYFIGAEIDTNFVVAILVVMGFSVHDTIVVFDRIRENIKNSKGAGDFNNLVNASVNQTLSRSINTSLTLVIAIIALLFFGPVNLQNFLIVILAGTLVGTYSSIFLASPLLTIWR
ncbi:MAG: protein translocase subunit SecF [Candidatus Harrisonbacteria bacterium]|nr:protein translocase subunit SecF [Candidatus Harrisonbacteria bacterium]